MIRELLLIIIGISGGILVGTAAAAFITLLDLVPRLSQVTNTSKYIHFYQSVLIIATTLTTIAHLLDYSLYFNKAILIPLGLILGGFVGLLASALAEVLNVMPILSRRLKLGKYIFIAMISIVLGKIIGSLIHWLLLSNI